MSNHRSSLTWDDQLLNEDFLRKLQKVPAGHVAMTYYDKMLPNFGVYVTRKATRYFVTRRKYKKHTFLGRIEDFSSVAAARVVAEERLKELIAERIAERAAKKAETRNKTKADAILSQVEISTACEVRDALLVIYRAMKQWNGG